MKYTLITAVCVVAFVMSGCGVAKKGNRGGPEVVNEVYGDVDVVKRVPDAGNHRERAQPTPTGSSASAKLAGQHKNIRTPIEFSARECEHVRLPGIHILPDEGVTLDLDVLRDEFCYPYRGKFISDYGYRSGHMHTGVDIKAVPNDTIRAAFAGVVRMSKVYSGYGNIVVIRHYNGIETLYGHNSRNLVKVNDAVEAGDPIALAGRTGRATTEHLHFEIRAGGEHIDPKLLIDPNAMCLRPGTLFVQQTAGRVIAATSREELECSSAQLASASGNTAEYKAAAAANPPASENRSVYHTVKNGDTLSAIARRYSTTVSKICGLNNLPNPDRLRLGQKLRVR